MQAVNSTNNEKKSFSVAIGSCLAEIVSGCVLAAVLSTVLSTRNYVYKEEQ